ncbi:hypothetical protein [Photorhabdus hindustanensis]|uniref:Uncharacterized protein n=1 Tax=Photorhabdus hindustanensis TaxID=2918802 RepID=A0A2S8PTK4_9GAMM|nr:hypothetical protein [Photorhabdus hindustanensis]PQQ22026.1 hypothetical protein C6H66_25335 [Photorhabdus hindustanensis]PQQ22145.1 hypothetical protein C6H66_24685 [Photorhabdus hindustanensis]
MKFEDLTIESQVAAREVLADMLRMKYQHELGLDPNVIRFLGHNVRKAFVALESEESCLPVAAIMLDKEDDHNQ